MTEADDFNDELSHYNQEYDNNKELNLLQGLKADPESFAKLLTAEIGLPIGVHGVTDGVRKLYTSTGLESKVNDLISGAKNMVSTKIAELKGAASDALSGASDALSGAKAMATDTLEGAASGARAAGAGALSDATAAATSGSTAARSIATGVVGDLADGVEGAVPEVAIDLATGASASRTGIDAGIGAGVNVGVNKVRSLVTNLYSRYKALTPRNPMATSDVEVNGVDELGGELEGETMGAVKSLSSTFTPRISALPNQSVSQIMEGAPDTAVANAEVGDVGALESEGLSAGTARTALQTGATAIQDGVLEGGAGESAVGALGGDVAAEATAAGGGLLDAAAATEEATGETGVGALLGGLLAIGGVAAYFAASHESAPDPIKIPNLAIPVFQPE
jgi:hypothetical protein